MPWTIVYLIVQGILFLYYWCYNQLNVMNRTGRGAKNSGNQRNFGTAASRGAIYGGS
jgi:hypothetical protein